MPFNIEQAEKNLSEQELQSFQEELEKNKKKLFTAYLYLGLLGPFGAHKFYLGFLWSGLVYLAIALVGGSLFISSVIHTIETMTFQQSDNSLLEILLTIVTVLNIIDSITLPFQLKYRDKKLKERILKKLNPISGYMPAS